MKARARRLYVACLIVLALGLGVAALVYFTADDTAPGSTYIVVDGQAYAVDPATSKTYVRELRRFGGQSAVLFDEFNRWFASLWQGARLGVTLAWLTIATAALLLALAWREDR